MLLDEVEEKVLATMRAAGLKDLTGLGVTSKELAQLKSQMERMKVSILPSHSRTYTDERPMPFPLLFSSSSHFPAATA